MTEKKNRKRTVVVPCITCCSLGRLVFVPQVHEETEAMDTCCLSSSPNVTVVSLSVMDKINARPITRFRMIIRQDCHSSQN